MKCSLLSIFFYSSLFFGTTWEIHIKTEIVKTRSNVFKGIDCRVKKLHFITQKREKNMKKIEAINEICIDINRKFIWKNVYDKQMSKHFNKGNSDWTFFFIVYNHHSVWSWYRCDTGIVWTFSTNSLPFLIGHFSNCLLQFKTRWLLIHIMSIDQMATIELQLSKMSFIFLLHH